MKNYNFGNYICEKREKKGMSQKELGIKIGVTNKAISKWENGQGYPSTELMLPLARALDVTIEDLYVAVSNSKKEITHIKRFINLLSFNNKKILLGVSILSAILYTLLILFYEIEEAKNLFIIITPIICIILYPSVRFMFWLQIKNPMAPDKFINFVTIVFLIFGSFMEIILLMQYFFDLKNNFTPTVILILWVIQAVIDANKKRI